MKLKEFAPSGTLMFCSTHRRQTVNLGSSKQTLESSIAYEALRCSITSLPGQSARRSGSIRGRRPIFSRIDEGSQTPTTSRADYEYTTQHSQQPRFLTV
nr:hypothetical protein CFP56_10500 [Quercus suber]